MEIADNLWHSTARDGKEHALITAGDKTTYYTGTKKAIEYKSLPKTPFKVYHTHPNWDSPLSGADIRLFLTQPNNLEMVAISKTNIYKVVRTPGTKGFRTPSEWANYEKNHQKSCAAQAGRGSGYSIIQFSGGQRCLWSSRACA